MAGISSGIAFAFEVFAGSDNLHGPQVKFISGGFVRLEYNLVQQVACRHAVTTFNPVLANQRPRYKPSWIT
jgi:hypothetical protein